VSGLISFSAAALRRKERRIRFGEDLVEREVARYVADRLRLRVGDVCGEGNEEAHLETALGFAQSAGETVKNSAQACRLPVFFEDREAIVPGVTAMDYDRQLCVACELQLAAEHWLLDFGGWFFIVIVEADFAPGYYLGIFRQRGQLRVVLFLDFGCVLRVDADGGVDPVVIFRDFDCGVEAVWAGAAAADGEDGLHACGLRALEHFGAIGIEFASFYRTLGAEVTVVEVLPRILPVEDAEIAAFARKSFEKQGITIYTGAKVTKLERKNDGVTASIDDGKGGTQTLSVDRVISAVGVVGNVENLGLEKLGVKTERGAIVVDGFCKTNVPGIYAIGDVAGPPLLAHKAEHEGVICVEAIKGLAPHPMDKRLIPGCTYCSPQIASVGITEQAAKEQKFDVRVGRFPFVGNGKAIALGEDQGLVKVIFDKKTGQLIGAHMVGAEVTELIQGYVIAMNLETTEEELMHTVFPHPTLSEMMKEAVLDAYGRVLNM